ncbi:MAG: hypothetical protein J6J43_01915 [Oscillospiraceae bacterium]|nr:hypothetical protein [Oscillospiraceae bacterium]
MGLFDSIKKPAQERPAGDQTYTVTLTRLPTDLTQLQQMPEGALRKPEHTAALTVAALCLYPANKEAALEILEYLHGPRGLSAYDKQFLADRFRDKDYVPRSYLSGATPQNDYEPTEPYTVTVFENPYSRDQLAEGYLTLHIRSGGADSPRQIKLRNKPSTGQWFLWEQFLLSDIRKPVSADPWA